jgi:hypothetical protein
LELQVNQRFAVQDQSRLHTRAMQCSLQVIARGTMTPQTALIERLGEKNQIVTNRPALLTRLLIDESVEDLSRCGGGVREPCPGHNFDAAVKSPPGIASRKIPPRLPSDPRFSLPLKTKGLVDCLAKSVVGTDLHNGGGEETKIASHLRMGNRE